MAESVIADGKQTVHKNLIDLTGQVFSRLTVIGRAPNKIYPSGGVGTYWYCVCECGKKTIVGSGHLRGGKTKSCGCILLEFLTSETGPGRSLFKYGSAGNRAYAAWMSAKHRTTNPKDRVYARYGGRGITMCDRWLAGFENFLEDMGYPDPGLTLDRIDNDLGYSPENCRWATMTQQARNKRNNRLLKIGDQEKTISEWSEISGVGKTVILRRFVKLGWEPERAVFEAPKDTRFKPRAQKEIP